MILSLEIVISDPHKDLGGTGTSHWDNLPWRKQGSIEYTSLSNWNAISLRWQK